MLTFLLIPKIQVVKMLQPRYAKAFTYGSHYRRWYTSNRTLQSDMERRTPICAGTGNISAVRASISSSPGSNYSAPGPNSSEEQARKRCTGTSPVSQPPVPPPPKNNIPYGWLGLLAVAGGASLAAYLYTTGNDTDKSGNKHGLSSSKKTRKRVPASSKDIPNEVPYLLIGGGTASFAAFRAIKSNNPKAKVMVITNEIEMPYMRPPLSKEMWLSSEPTGSEQLKFKQWNGVERSLYYEPDDFYVDPSQLFDSPNGGVAIVRGYTIKHIDVCNRIATLTDGTEIRYEECLLATGSQPKNLDIFSTAPNNVKHRMSLFKTIEDFEHLKSNIKNIHSVAVIGGGFLGSELSCALAKYGETHDLKVYQIFHEKGNMGKVLPEYLSEWTTQRVRDEGVKVIPATQVEAVKSQNEQVRLKLMNGQDLLVDHVIIAVGSTPDVSLAKGSGLEVDSKHGGFVVNAELEARRHLYVAGDAACFYDTKLGRRRVEHHDHAVVSGRLAGENMVGLKKPYKHQSMFWSDLGPKVGYEAIGIIDSSLPTVGVFAKGTLNDSPISSGGNHLAGDASDDKKSTKETTTVAAPVTSTDAASKDKNESDGGDDFGKGVVFYLRDEKVVGIVLWNVFNRINIARSIINEDKKYDDLNEVAKLFEIHL